MHSVAPEAVWQVGRPPYQSDEIWAVNSYWPAKFFVAEKTEQLMLNVYEEKVDNLRYERRMVLWKSSYFVVTRNVKMRLSLHVKSTE